MFAKERALHPSTGGYHGNRCLLAKCSYSFCLRVLSCVSPVVRISVQRPAPVDSGHSGHLLIFVDF